MLASHAIPVYYSLLRVSSKNSLPDSNRRLQNKDKLSNKQNQSFDSSQNNNSNRQVNSSNLKRPLLVKEPRPT